MNICDSIFKPRILWMNAKDRFFMNEWVSEWVSEWVCVSVCVFFVCRKKNLSIQKVVFIDKFMFSEAYGLRKCLFNKWMTVPLCYWKIFNEAEFNLCACIFNFSVFEFVSFSSLVKHSVTSLKTKFLLEWLDGNDDDGDGVIESNAILLMLMTTTVMMLVMTMALMITMMVLDSGACVKERYPPHLTSCLRKIQRFPKWILSGNLEGCEFVFENNLNWNF